MFPWPSAALILIAACDSLPPRPVNDIEAACEARARGAMGPTGSVTIGMNSEDGPQMSGAIGISGDFMRQRDPMQVYEGCVFAATGQMPTRRPNL